MTYRAEARPRPVTDPETPGSQPPEAAGPVGAVRRYYTRSLQFSGRASRSEFWWMLLWFCLVSLLGAVLVSRFGGGALEQISDQDPDSFNGFGRALAAVWGLGALVHLLPSLALLVRRLHDVNFGGLWVLTSLIPVLGFVFLLICALMPSEPRGARFDWAREAEQFARTQREAGHPVSQRL